MGLFKAENPGDAGRTSNSIPFQVYMLEVANYSLESGERTEACFLQDPSQTLRQQGILGMLSFKLYLSVKVNWWHNLYPLKGLTEQPMLSLMQAASTF